MVRALFFEVACFSPRYPAVFTGIYPLDSSWCSGHRDKFAVLPLFSYVPDGGFLLGLGGVFQFWGRNFVFFSGFQTSYSHYGRVQILIGHALFSQIWDVWERSWSALGELLASSWESFWLALERPSDRSPGRPLKSGLAPPRARIGLHRPGICWLVLAVGSLRPTRLGTQSPWLRVAFSD